MDLRRGRSYNHPIKLEERLVEQQHEEQQRLRAFLNLFIAAAAFFVLLEVSVYPFMPEPWILTKAVITGTFGLLLGVGRWMVERRRLTWAVLWVSCVLLLTLVLLNITLPGLHDVYITLALATGALIIPRFEGWRLWLLLVAALAVVVLSVVAGALLTGVSPPERWFSVTISVLGVLWTVPLAFLLLIQQGRRLQEAHEALSESNAELQASVAEQRLVERSLEERSAQMEQLIYTVSHDLKAPLVTSSGFLSLALEDLEAGALEELPDALQRAAQANARMGELIGDLLALLQVGSVPLELEAVALGPLVEAVCEELAASGQLDGVELTVASELPTARADPRRVRQMLDNLILNAVVHGCPGGVGRVEIGAEALNPEEVELYVRDHGPGIALDHQERAFGLFERLGARTPGTGAGLAIVRQLAELHGGGARVESEPGQGATFWLRLPRQEGLGEG